MHVGYRNATLGRYAYQASAYGYAATQRQIYYISVVERLHANAGSIACISAAAHSNCRIVQRCAHALLVIAGTNISISHSAAHCHRCTSAPGKPQGAGHSDDIRIIFRLHSNACRIGKRIIDSVGVRSIFFYYGLGIIIAVVGSIGAHQCTIAPASADTGANSIHITIIISVHCEGSAAIIIATQANPTHIGTSCIIKAILRPGKACCSAIHIGNSRTQLACRAHQCRIGISIHI